MGLNPLYDVLGPEKTAGIKISKSPKQWAMEVIKALKSEHPYIDGKEAKIKFEDIDPEEKSARGAIIIKKSIAAPFTIGMNEDTRRVELNPIDILFIPEPGYEDGHLRHFNESSYRQAVQQEDVGRPFPRGDNEQEEYGKLPAKNEYIGDLTGDVTPLEYSGYPNAISGGGALRTAQSGSLSRIIHSQDQLQDLKQLLNDKNGLNLAAENIGLKDVLDNLETEGDDPPRRNEPGRNAPVTQIRRKDNGQIVIEYSNGHSAPISGVELEETLGSDFRPVMRKVMGRGWAIVRNFPTIKTPEVPVVNTLPGPVESGGWYELATSGGSTQDGLVCPQMLDFDGQVIRRQKVLCEHGGWDVGKTFLGRPTQEGVDCHPAAKSEFGQGKKGCFLTEAFGEYQCTPNVTITQIVERPDTGLMAVGKREDTMSRVGLIFLDNLIRPREVHSRDLVDDILPEESYYIPTSFEFIEVGDRKNLLVESDRKTVESKDDRPVAYLRKQANWYDLRGKTEHGQVEEPMMREPQMRMKLAMLGCDDHVIEKACEMEDDKMPLRGLRPSSIRLKKEATSKTPNTETFQKAFGEFKKYAQQAVEGYNRAVEQSAPEASQRAQDPRVMDAILSMHFADSDTLEELAECEQLFGDAEDKIGRLLMAARRGIDGLDERGLQKALKGLGKARKSLKTLKIELESGNI